MDSGDNLRNAQKFGLKLIVKSKRLACSFLLLGSVLANSQAYAECYEYDDLGRLLNVTYDNAGNAQSSYNLDKHGNRITVSTTATSATSCVAPDGSTRGYEEGAMTSEQARTKPVPPSPGNQNPIAVDDNLSVLTESTQTAMPLEGDSDPDGDTLTVTSISETSNLIDATLNGEVVTIVSGVGEGLATITYTISDGNGGTAQGNINVTITAPENENPVADDEEVSMLADSIQIVMPLEGDTDPDGDTLTIESISESSVLLDATLDGDSVIIASNSNAGNATVTYTISDGNGGTAQGNINVTITEPAEPPIEVCYDETGMAIICDLGGDL